MYVSVAPSSNAARRAAVLTMHFFGKPQQIKTELHTGIVRRILAAIHVHRP